MTGLDGEQQKVVGGFLVGLAVVLGIILLVRGFADDGGLTAAPTTTTTVVTVPEDDRDEPPAIDPGQTTTPDAVTPADVAVLVANATGGMAGAAGTIETQLADAGYPSAGTVNAAAVASTQIYYVGEAQAEAEAVAEVLGVGTASVAPVPEPAPVPDISGAVVIVLVGPELVS